MKMGVMVVMVMMGMVSAWERERAPKRVSEDEDEDKSGSGSESGICHDINRVCCFACSKCLQSTCDARIRCDGVHVRPASCAIKCICIHHVYDRVKYVTMIHTIHIR